MTAVTRKCPTCRSPVAHASVEWEDVVEGLVASVYCSIHCEHYAGLARARVDAHAA